MPNFSGQGLDRMKSQGEKPNNFWPPEPGDLGEGPPDEIFERSQERELSFSSSSGSWTRQLFLQDKERKEIRETLQAARDDLSAVSGEGAPKADRNVSYMGKLKTSCT